MKEKIMSYLPFIFTYYTIIVLSTCTYNSLLGNSYMKNTWFFEVLAYLIIFTIFDHILGLINFKSNLTYTLAETGTAYVLFLIFGYVFHWISFTFTNLLGTTLLFLFIATIGITYLTYRHKLRTKELNDLIQKQNR